MEKVGTRNGSLRSPIIVASILVSKIFNQRNGSLRSPSGDLTNISSIAHRKKLVICEYLRQKN